MSSLLSFAEKKQQQFSTVKLFLLFFLWGNGVVAALEKRIAAQNTAYRQQ